MPAKILLSAVLAFALGSLGCISGEVSDDEVCVTQANIAFPAMPIMGIAGEVTQSFDIDLHDQLSKLSGNGIDSTGSQVNLMYVKFVAKSGVTDFDFIYTLKLSAPALLIDYTMVEGSHVPSPFEMPADATINLFEKLSAGKTTLTLDVVGALPTTAWSVDATLCFSLDLKAKKSL